jgi:hypothetical protein
VERVDPGVELGRGGLESRPAAAGEHEPIEQAADGAEGGEALGVAVLAGGDYARIPEY